MLTAEFDTGLRLEFADNMPERCSDLELHLIKGIDHWVQQEKADEVSGLFLSWLARRF